MTGMKRCSYYRDFGNSKGNRFKGYCDLDRELTVCRGDLQLCKKVNLLRKSLLEERKRERGSGW